MSQKAKRISLITLAIGVFAVALAACAAPATPAPPSTGGGVNAFHTPNAALQSPTPAFPGFTVGAWPSDYSPAAGGTVTIYVICRIQDPSMAAAPRPAAGQVVTINVGAPLNLAQNVTTDNSGLADWQLTIVDQQGGSPVVVTVTTNYRGHTYSTATFFTPSPIATPSPSASPTGTPSVTPSLTPGA
jgi:hypothetical protein